jgi:hypothetical protein
MIIEAILKINPNAEVSVLGDDINTCEITWHNGTTPIPIADIQAQFKVVEFEIAIGNLREKRNSLLTETDYIVIKAKETGATISTAWKTYRQALRDITENLTTVEEVNAVVFPDKP